MCGWREVAAVDAKGVLVWHLEGVQLGLVGMLLVCDWHVVNVWLACGWCVSWDVVGMWLEWPGVTHSGVYLACGWHVCRWCVVFMCLVYDWHATGMWLECGSCVVGMWLGCVGMWLRWPGVTPSGVWLGCAWRVVGMWLHGLVWHLGWSVGLGCT